MKKSTLRFLDAPKGPLDQTFENRVTDWREEGKHLLELFDKHEEEYRKNICSTCSVEQQTKRKCLKIRIDDEILTYCDHMNRARCAKFKKEIQHHIYSHPALFTINMLQKNLEYFQITTPQLALCKYYKTDSKCYKHCNPRNVRIVEPFRVVRVEYKRNHKQHYSH